MCMIESADGYCTVIAERNRTARIEHKCTECFRVIRRGEVYLYERTKFDGDLNDWKTCVHCQRVRAWLTDECGGWLWGGIEEDIREHAEDPHYGIAVKMMAVGMARNWARKNGEPWPLPRMPKTSAEMMAAEPGETA